MMAQVVAITGASSGIGRAVAHAYAREGARVGLIARNGQALENASREVAGLGGEAFVQVTDVSQADAVEGAAAAIEDRFGAIDVWVNDAMVTVFAPVHALTPEEFRRVTEVTYLGTVYGTMAALRRMRARDRGTIVQVGSALAYRSIPLQSAYCGAKAAIRGFTDSLRTELLHDGSQVRITMVQLPAVNTPQFDVQRNKLERAAQPMPPIYSPALAAEAIVWAARHAPREIAVGGSALQAILAQSLAPGLVDRYLAKTGYDAQQREQRNEPRADNLFAPIDFDPGTLGRFAEQEKDASLQLWLRTRTPALVAALGVGALGLALRLLKR